ncbi:hypothetical protein BDF14DRAFT_182978 [Spinellus fusiger]|nr:hypothetical protein BDF14DRAFT_182978 [Spinellus fusiger]
MMNRVISSFYSSLATFLCTIPFWLKQFYNVPKHTHTHTHTFCERLFLQRNDQTCHFLTLSKIYKNEICTLLHVEALWLSGWIKRRLSPFSFFSFFRQWISCTRSSDAFIGGGVEKRWREELL